MAGQTEGGGQREEKESEMKAQRALVRGGRRGDYTEKSKRFSDEGNSCGKRVTSFDSVTFQSSCVPQCHMRGLRQ